MDTDYIDVDFRKMIDEMWWHRILIAILMCVMSILIWGCKEERADQSSPRCLADDSTCNESTEVDLGVSSDLGMSVDMSSEVVVTDMASPEDQSVSTEPYEVIVFEREPIYSYGETNFQNALADLDFGVGPFAEVKLTVELHTTCFPFEGWADDPPPEGHNWPPSCDAFDRNFELHMTPDNGPLNPESDRPAEFELMRAITPFGGPSRHVLDITDYANAYPGSNSIRVHITTWSDGAGQVSGSQGMWRVSVTAQVTPGEQPRSVIGLVPVFNRSLRLDDGPLEVPFSVPQNVRRARLEYRTTGHGGGDDMSATCIGPAEEFCRRTHILGIDGRDLDMITPWRDDCELGCTVTRYEGQGNSFEYCSENPTGLRQSVEAPRANWCPGSLTPPFEYDVPNYTLPGEHSFYLEVKDLHPSGVWRVSAMVYLYGD